MLLAGEMYNNERVVEFAKTNLATVINAAWLDEGAWGISPLAEEKNIKRWWIFAELDQAAIILNFDEKQQYTNYLAETQPFWFRNFVDSEGEKEVFPDLDQNNNPVMDLKIHHWKNGFHSAEHALFGIIHAAFLNNEPLELFYAFSNNSHPKEDQLNPFYYKAKIDKKESVEINNKNMPGLPALTKIQFTNIELLKNLLISE